KSRVAMDVGDLLHHGPGDLVAALHRPIGQWRDGIAELAVAIGPRELARHAVAALAAGELGIAVAQHQMREVEIELMRRHVGTFGHEAEVAERAGLDHAREVLALHVMQLAAGGLVDEIEQPREAVAEIEAAPAAMADVEDPAHLRVELLRIG